MGIHHFSPDEFAPQETFASYRLANRLLDTLGYSRFIPVNNQGETELLVSKDAPIKKSGVLLNKECTMRFFGKAEGDIGIGYLLPGRGLVGVFGMWPEKPPFGFVTDKEVFDTVRGHIGVLLLNDIIEVAKSLE